MTDRTRSAVAEGIMKNATKLIFGIRTHGNTSLSLSVNGQLPVLPPPLLISTRGQSEVTIPCSNGTWTAALGHGDHVVRVLVPDDSWFKDPLIFALGAPATIVIPGDAGSAQLKTWTAAAGAADDPKNPWPPPLVSQLDPEALADSMWLGDTLTTLNAQVASTRSASGHLPGVRNGGQRSG